MAENSDKKLASEIVVVFDLDDTLYAERDYAYSAYAEVARLFESCPGGSKNAFSTMCLRMNMRHNPFDTLLRLENAPSIDEILKVYRLHKPTISLRDGAEDLLDYFKKNGIGIGIITDGRSITQRNKIEALQLLKFIPQDAIFISEEQGADKLEHKSFEAIEHLYPNASYFYIGDNPVKDFIIANSRGWKTILLMDRSATNVHPQLPHPPGGAPALFIDSLSELKTLIDSNY